MINDKLDQLVVDVSAWAPLTNIRCTKREDKKLSGVYQLTMDPQTDLLFEECGYVGKSSHIHDRLYTLRLAAQGKKGNHSCGKWIKSMGHNLDDIHYRILYTANEKDADSLEKLIQAENFRMYKYTFKWQEAGENKRGKEFQMKDMIANLDLETIIREVIPVLKKNVGILTLKDLLDEKASIVFKNE